MTLVRSDYWVWSAASGKRSITRVRGKPTGFVEHHEHLFGSREHHDAEAGRVDVCALDDGSCVVWEVDYDEQFPSIVDGVRERWTWDQAMETALDIVDGRQAFVDQRYVKVMCDFGADPIWQKDGVMACLSDLPVSLDIRKRLRAWADVYEGHDGFFGAVHEQELDEDAFTLWGLTGLSIAQAIKAALPDWTVIYHDELMGYTQDRKPYASRNYEV